MVCQNFLNANQKTCPVVFPNSSYTWVFASTATDTILPAILYLSLVLVVLWYNWALKGFLVQLDSRHYNRHPPMGSLIISTRSINVLLSRTLKTCVWNAVLEHSTLRFPVPNLLWDKPKTLLDVWVDVTDRGLYQTCPVYSFGFTKSIWKSPLPRDTSDHIQLTIADQLTALLSTKVLKTLYLSINLTSSFKCKAKLSTKFCWEVEWDGSIF